MTLAMRAKLALATVITTTPVGVAVGTLTRQNVPCRGLRFWTDSVAISPRIRAAMLWGLYESAELRLINAHLRDDLDIVELGSSIGVTTGHVLRRMGLDRRLVAVEANPDLLPVLRRNIARHERGQHVSVVGAAIASGCCSDIVHLATSGESSDSKLGSIGVPVRATTLSTLLAASQVGEFALVSDIEGSEGSFLVEDAPCLARCRQMIIELHDSEQQGRRYSAEDLVDTTSALGFTVTARRGPVVCFDRT